MTPAAAALASPAVRGTAQERFQQQVLLVAQRLIACSGERRQSLRALLKLHSHDIGAASHRLLR